MRETEAFYKNILDLGQNFTHKALLLNWLFVRVLLTIHTPQLQVHLCGFLLLSTFFGLLASGK